MGFLDQSGPQTLKGADVYAFVIRDITGLSVAGAKAAPKATHRGNEFVMTGRGLPYRPFTLSGSQRLTMTWLPGYSSATTQALGSKEEVTTIRGKWSDKFIAYQAEPKDDLGPLGGAFSAIDKGIASVGTAITGQKIPPSPKNESVPLMWAGVRLDSVYDATDRIDIFRRTAAYIEVNWGRHSRRGFITKFTQDWLNAHDVEWEMEFTWSSRGEPVDPVVSETLLSVDGTTSLMQALADALNTEALPPTFPMTTELLADIQSGLDRIAATTQAISDTINNVTTLVLSPLAIARSVIALATTLNGQCFEMRQRLIAQGNGAKVLWEQVSRDRSFVTPPTTSSFSLGRKDAILAQRNETHASHANTAKAAEYTGRVLTALRKLASTAVLVRDTYRKQTERDAKAIVTAREGDDLRQLSTTYYGTPNEWRRIANANGLTSARLIAGLQIVIPATSFDEDAC